MVPIVSEASLRPDLRSSTFIRLRRGTTLEWLRIIVLALLDSALIVLAWRVAEILGTPMNSPWSSLEHPVSFLPVIGLELGLLSARGLYRPGESRRDYFGLFKAISMAQVLLLLMAFFYAPGQFVSRSQFILFWLFNLAFTGLGRFSVDQTTEFLRTKGIVRYPVFLISDAEFQDQSIQLIEKENRYNILGIASARALDRGEREATLAKIRRLGIVEVFVSWDAIKNRLFLCWHFQTAGITLHVLPLGMEPLFKNSEVWMIGGSPSPTFPPPVLTGIDFWIKRVLDVIGAAILLVVLSPVLILIALLIKLDSPGPVFYRQVRIGLHSRPFKVWKFRTMVVNADKLQAQLEASNEMKDGILFKMKDDPRITRVGKFLRQYSLDELPQLINILMGEMSLVGPRPLPVRDVEKFAERHFIRHEVVPGITGLWQVSGRSEIDDFEHVVNLDLSYIENWSLWLDFTILLRTIGVVLRKTGAY